MCCQLSVILFLIANSNELLSTFSEDFTEVSDDPNAYNFTAQIDELNSANIWLGQMLPRYTFNVVDLGTVMAKAIHNREVWTFYFFEIRLYHRIVL